MAVSPLVSRDEAFDARTAERSFRIGLTDSVEVLLGPALFPPLRARAGHPVAPSTLVSCNPSCSPRPPLGQLFLGCGSLGCGQIPYCH
jgi:hypothetical protein